MKIQSTATAMGYFKTLKYKEANEQNISQLMLDEDDKKTNRPRFEVRNEGGYIRKYIVKANGDKILIMETKQTIAQEGMQSNESGNLIDIAHDMLVKQHEKSSDLQIQEKQTMAAWVKENGISKYKTGI
ncbi:MAG TPA: hypothetical protein K8V56_18460 [Sporosarcina psychrophila]|uniref:Uncharacterized protein n=1 Tax=Sporosarcina psychrophila TaxID=1476 RepID=A0A921G1G6_SPOPS|nr:hypothetical protein [Sporosarcina psychrophila]